MSTARIKSTDTLQGGNDRSIMRNLRHRWFLLSAVGLVVALSVALSWNWLVAAGIASVLLSVLPCLVMCGLGLCMQKVLGTSRSAAAASPESQAQTDGNRSLLHVTSCCGAGSFGSGSPADAAAEAASEPKEKTHA